MLKGPNLRPPRTEDDEGIEHQAAKNANLLRYRTSSRQALKLTTVSNFRPSVAKLFDEVEPQAVKRRSSRRHHTPGRHEPKCTTIGAAWPPGWRHVTQTIGETKTSSLTLFRGTGEKQNRETGARSMLSSMLVPDGLSTASSSKLSSSLVLHGLMFETVVNFGS